MMTPTPKLTKTRIAPTAVALLLGTFCAWLPASAQTQAESGSADPSPRGDQPIQLSTFVVDTQKDTGYVATDSLIGGRMSTKLLMTPSDISVLTREFLDDVAAENYLDASVWLPNASVINPAGNVPTDNGNLVSFRGLSGSYPSRNYFRYQNNIDAYVLEREENARGPNSLLFGDGVIGGMLNFITKQATTTHPITAFQVKVDSEGSRRGTVDVNRAFGDKLAIRLNLLADQGRTWVPTYFNNRYGGQISALYRPTRNTDIRIEAETGNWMQNYPPAFTTDNNSSWNRTYAITAPLKTTNAPAGSGVARFGTDRLVFAPDMAGIGVQNYLYFGTTQGSSLPIPAGGRPIANYPTIARDFSLQPPNFDTHNNYNVEAASIDQKLSDDLVAQVAFQHSQSVQTFDQGYWNVDQIDINAILPNGASNPHFLKDYAEVNPVFQFNNQYNTDFRAALAYQLPVKAFSQRFNFIFGNRSSNFIYQNERYARSNGSDPNMQDTVNIAYVRYYFADGPSSFSLPPDGNGYQFGYVHTANSVDDQTLNTVTLATVGSYWDDRISLVAGLQRVFYHDDQTVVSAFDAHGQPAAYKETLTNQAETQPTIGAVVFPIKWIGAYFNYSETFNPAITAGFPKLDGVFASPVVGRGTSEGIRLNLFDGKLIGSIGRYDMHQVNNTLTYTTVAINHIWDDLNLSQHDIAATSYTDTLTDEATGYEIDLIANPTSSFRLSSNLSFPKTVQTDTIPETRAYYKANIAAWQAGANDLTNVNHADIQTNLNTINTNIQNANEGRQLNGTSKYTANVFGIYTFQSGPLRNFRFGGGVNVFGKSIIGNVFNQPFNYVYRDSYSMWTAVAGYSCKIFGSLVDLQLNVSNLFNYSKPIYTSTTTYLSQTVPLNFYYQQPRKAAVTATFKF